MTLSKFFKLTAVAFVLSLALVATPTFAVYTPPQDQPPTCNTGDPGCDSPVHTGIAEQIKSGSLGIINFVGANPLDWLWSGINADPEEPGLLVEGFGFFNKTIGTLGGLLAYGIARPATEGTTEQDLTAQIHGNVGAQLYCDLNGENCIDPANPPGGSGGGDSLWATSTTNINNIYNKNSGNVGVGTNDPTAKLDVVGNVKITDGTQGAGKVLQSNATGLASWVATSTLGIGGGSVTNIFNTVSWPWASTSPTSDIVYARNTVSPYAGGIAIGVAPASANINSQLQVFGKVAIGNNFTTTLIPTNNIHIKDNDTTQTGIDIENSSAGGHRWRMQTVGSGIAGRVGNFEIWDAGAPSVIGITIKPTVIAGLPSSHIGIGTLAPVAKLDVAGNVKITDGTQGAGKVLQSDASGLASWVATSTLGIGGGGTNFWAGSLTGNVNNANTGNIGIGTVAPATKLDVVGTLRATDVIAGTVTANSVEAGGYVRAFNHFANVDNAGYWFGPVNTYNYGVWRPAGTNNVALRANNTNVLTINNTGLTELSGQIKINGGAPGVGKVLQSNATGLASWVATSSLGFSSPTFVLDTVIAKSPTGGSAEVKVAVCPAGYKVMGGGFQELSDENDDQDASAPLSSRTQNYNDPTATDRWFCEDDPGPSVCYAVCGRIIQQ